ncbi:DUF6803 family protein [Cellulomonas endophytica]|uniref:DUF6803 family protein n=1 Tax=Cellulomonas endophytica TaxID=2494735 RepID=UPI001F0C1489|nr:DUF6803 family protein [Cellulomonas endophytica]
MTTTPTPVPAPRPTLDPRALAAPDASLGRTATAALLAGVVAVVAVLLPAWPAGPDMGSTHYMGLLAANQPWNLLVFMAVPVVLAETVAVTELVVLLGRRVPAAVRALNRWAGILGGVWFLGVTVYLLRHAVVPLTVGGDWRGPADVVAVGAYLLGVVPLVGLALVETRVVGPAWDADRRRAVHAGLVGLFLVVAHVAMIAGMLDPTVLGWAPTHTMTDGATMPGTSH